MCLEWCLKRRENLGITAHTHYRKTVFCRVPESSPCALFRAHDEDLLCRVSPEEHTAKKKHTGNLTLRRVPRASTRQTLIFAVCQPVGTRRTWITCGAHPSAVRGPHGRYCLPCARARHTANSHLRRVPVGWHTANSPAAVNTRTDVTPVPIRRVSTLAHGNT